MSGVSVHHFFDPATFTLTYVVWDPKTHDAVVIDPVMDYDPVTQLVSTTSVTKILNFVARKRLLVRWILETHAHADHLSAARELKRHWPQADWGMGQRMTQVFSNFQKVFHWPSSVRLEALGVNRWFGDGEEFCAGSLHFQAMGTPGHTPACLSFRVGPCLFTGDALMMPDAGVGRCDFPGGDAGALYDSIWGKIYAFPDATLIYVGHDYQPGGRALAFRTTVGEEMRRNVHLPASLSRQDFVIFREARDKTLAAPRLLHPSLDWNLGAHQLVKALN